MTNYYFIGDGSEVLACESYVANARDAMKELQAKTDDSLTIYECNPSEITRDNSTESGNWVWAYPAERAIAEKFYDLPSLRECIADVEALDDPNAMHN